jgi:hypothetical protein
VEYDLPTSAARVFVRLVHPFPLPDGNLLPRSLQGMVLAVFSDRMDVEFPVTNGAPIIATVPTPWLELIEDEPPAEPAEHWAIVECLGHQTLVGRVTETEQYGVRGIRIEPLFDGVLLAPVFRAGASLYGVTPCTRDQALALASRNAWTLPESVRALLPPALLDASQPRKKAVTDADFDDAYFDDDEDPPDPETFRTGVRVSLLREVNHPSAGIALAYGTRGLVVDTEPDGRIAVEFACGVLTFDRADLMVEPSGRV